MKNSAGLLAVLAALTAVFSCSLDRFFSPATLQSLLNQIPALTFVSVGMTFVLITGGIDLSAGSLIAIQGFASLGNIGVEAFTGFLAALVNVRLTAPVVTGQSIAATVGAGATAELGAMRISEEIDALEVMGIKSISYLVSTRLVAASVVIIPLYAMSLIMAFLAAQLTTTVLYGQSSGTYLHYFHTFLRAEDVFWSFVVVIVISVFVMINHCYFGYNASGGPVGVGQFASRHRH
jgi:phospholipid/cholesterol/gamma-HCH transport system permease protein